MTNRYDRNKRIKRIYLKFRTEKGDTMLYVARSQKSLNRFIKNNKLKNRDIIYITTNRPINFDQSLEDIRRSIEAFEYFYGEDIYE